MKIAHERAWLMIATQPVGLERYLQERAMRRT